MAQEKDFKIVALEHINKERERKNAVMRDCPCCQKPTPQTMAFYNPDEPEQGMVYECVECKESVGWV